MLTKLISAVINFGDINVKRHFINKIKKCRIQKGKRSYMLNKLNKKARKKYLYRRDKRKNLCESKNK
jgi:hypothetical protein